MMDRIALGFYALWTAVLVVVAVGCRLVGMLIGTMVAAFVAGYQAGKR